jgi:hypothetical protein
MAKGRFHAEGSSQFDLIAEALPIRAEAAVLSRRRRKER